MADTPILGLSIDPKRAPALFEQIYQALRIRIIDGRFATGDRLPPTRKLALELGVSRSTIVAAYDQLIAEGFADARTGAGVLVSGMGAVERVAPPAPPPRTPPRQPTSVPIPFQPGLPDARLFPYRQWAKVVARAARTCPQALVHMEHPFGDWNLRVEICRYLADWRGVQASPDQVLITAGATDALELCVRALIAPGNGIYLEDPGYPPLRAFVDSLDIPALNLKMDTHGGLPPKPKKGTTPANHLVVLTPSSQFPLGGVMPQARRNAFIAWAIQHNSWIIEDDYDSEFRYSGRPIPAMASLDGAGRTLYIGSFSKIFSTGLRLGFVVMPLHLITTFDDTLRRFGGKASIAPQRPLSMFMEQGEYYRHIRRVRRIYGERREVFIDLLQTHLADLATFDDHKAGMQIAVQFPETLNDVRLSEAAANAGLSCPALSRYCASRSKLNGLLMGYCSFMPEEMRDAIKRLVQAINT